MNFIVQEASCDTKSLEIVLVFFTIDTPLYHIQFLEQVKSDNPYNEQKIPSTVTIPSFKKDTYLGAQLGPSCHTTKQLNKIIAGRKGRAGTIKKRRRIKGVTFPFLSSKQSKQEAVLCLTMTIDPWGLKIEKYIIRGATQQVGIVDARGIWSSLVLSHKQYYHYTMNCITQQKS